MFEDLLEANVRYRAEARDTIETGKAARHLAVVTCIDTRIDPLAVLGLRPGDAKIIRNAGARVTDDVLRSLIIATNLLDVRRICLMHHTDCAMIGRTEQELRDLIAERRGMPTGEWEFLSTTDGNETLRADLERIEACELLAPDVVVGGFLFDVHTGSVRQVDPS